MTEIEIATLRADKPSNSGEAQVTGVTYEDCPKEKLIPWLRAACACENYVVVFFYSLIHVAKMFYDCLKSLFH